MKLDGQTGEGRLHGHWKAIPSPVSRALPSELLGGMYFVLLSVLEPDHLFLYTEAQEIIERLHSDFLDELRDYNTTGL